MSETTAFINNRVIFSNVYNSNQNLMIKCGVFFFYKKENWLLACNILITKNVYKTINTY